MSGWKVTVRQGWLGGWVATARLGGQPVMRITRSTESRARRDINAATAREDRSWRKYADRDGRVRSHWI
jgi:hypothetical protein